MAKPQEAFDAFQATLKRHEKYYPSQEQIKQLRIACETDYGISHEAPYAHELFVMACDGLGGDSGSVFWVHSLYGDLVAFVRLVQSEKVL